jgi:hypothetical protein
MVEERESTSQRPAPRGQAAGVEGSTTPCLPAWLWEVEAPGSKCPVFTGDRMTSTRFDLITWRVGTDGCGDAGEATRPEDRRGWRGQACPAYVGVTFGAGRRWVSR